MKKKPVLYIVIPCYNEEECLAETARQLEKKLIMLEKQGKIKPESRVVYVDDGSKDRTWELIENFKHKSVVGLKLAHNRGHQNALLAGLEYAKDYADVIVSMDADLQDDLNAIDKFLQRFSEGYEIVYGVRGDRKTDTKFKRRTAQLFYKIMLWLGVELVYNSADCRLMSKRAVEELSKYKEVNLFLRGIVPTIGLKSTTVEYERAKRLAGESKYPLRKMLNFAWDGVTSFSIKPIRMILTLGVVMMVISFVILIYSLVVKIIGEAVSGWTFTICSIWLLGGIQMISIGLIGEYIGKIYSETKARPRYIIEKIIS